MPDNQRLSESIGRGAKWTADLFEYCQDSAQRAILFMDILRQRGNIYSEHLRQGQPPVLAFNYETILDGRKFERPVNYALIRITDRRFKPVSDRRHSDAQMPAENGNRRKASEDQRHHPIIGQQAPGAVRRPIIIFDPRAGHGPGIGGTKEDSQIGMALDAGHPVYLSIFFTRPVPGQTLADVRDAQIRFVEKVRHRHRQASRPAIIGNCQGGWAAALVGAERPDLVGPMAFNGSPLSYWGGVLGINPMRYFGGLLGGTWLNSLLSDLGNGYFDGAWLVANFENLNPANTLWTKQYHVYANVDTEAKRYLEFEKWWGGFFLLSDKEIHQIVEGLFIGNKLERGEFEIERGRYVDLKNNQNPVVLFASFGDNITPPQQAFNWISKTYGTTDEIKRRGQVIVYIGHSQIGHLGIFVSAKIALKEHREIIASFDMLGYMPPGLFEMQIVEDHETPGEYEVHYVEKKIRDIQPSDNGEDEAAFLAVRRISEAADLLYRTSLSPWIRMFNNETTAEALRQLHPLRMQRSLLSDLNPWMMPINALASIIKNGYRLPADPENPFQLQEKKMSDIITRGLDLWRDARDTASELLFRAIYESPGMKLLASFDGTEDEIKASGMDALHKSDARYWRTRMDKGEFAEAVIRILLAVLFADGTVSRKGHRIINQIFAEHKRMGVMEPKNLRRIIWEQARIVQTDAGRAIDSLSSLLSRKKDREEALTMTEQVINGIGNPLTRKEQKALERIHKVLGKKAGAKRDKGVKAPRVQRRKTSPDAAKNKKPAE